MTFRFFILLFLTMTKNAMRLTYSFLADSDNFIALKNRHEKEQLTLSTFTDTIFRSYTNYIPSFKVMFNTLVQKLIHQCISAAYLVQYYYAHLIKM